MTPERIAELRALRTDVDVLECLDEIERLQQEAALACIVHHEKLDDIRRLREFVACVQLHDDLRTIADRILAETEPK